jgi:purine nucleosidase/pyrimidine-specific ribonucleoside hydrolase
MNSRKLLLLIIGAICIISFVVGCSFPVTTPTVTPSLTHITPTATFIPIVASTVTNEPTSPAKKIFLIYDDDGSRDGTAALLYLLSQPEISIKAINISYGEAHPKVYIQYMGRMLDSFGIQDIPLGAGQDAPLARGTAFPDWLRQLSDNFWNYPLPNAGKTYPVQDAPDLIVSTINQSSEPVTIFLSGTFTNLAQALRIDPGIRDKIDAVYIMGGAVYVPGNITNLIPDSSNKVSEWNIYADPQAAKEVFEASLNMYLVPLDTTNKVIFHKEDILPWHNGDGKANLTADLYDIMFNEYGFQKAEIFDLGAAVIMVKPETCAFQPLHLDVVTDDGITSGQTVVVPNGKPNIQACLNPNAALIMQALNDSFSSTTKTLEIPSIDPIIGTWTGSVLNNGFEMQVSLTIEETCQLGQMCGRFNISTVSCSGTLTWVGMDGELYQFQAGEKTEGCGEGIDYLLPQTDGTIMYISRGNYGETKGTLQREP